MAFLPSCFAGCWAGLSIGVGWLVGPASSWVPCRLGKGSLPVEHESTGRRLPALLYMRTVGPTQQRIRWAGSDRGELALRGGLREIEVALACGARSRAWLWGAEWKQALDLTEGKGDACGSGNYASTGHAVRVSPRRGVGRASAAGTRIVGVGRVGRALGFWLSCGCGQRLRASVHGRPRLTPAPARKAAQDQQGRHVAQACDLCGRG